MKENRGRKNWPAVVAVLAVFALIGSAFVYTRFRKEDGTAMLETLKKETVRSETSQIYHPGYEALAYDESSGTLYYDNMLIVYLLARTRSIARNCRCFFFILLPPSYDFSII